MNRPPNIENILAGMPRHFPRVTADDVARSMFRVLRERKKVYTTLDEDEIQPEITARRLTATATLNFPSIAAQGQEELTVGVDGAAPGDPVAVSPPASINNGLIAWGYVSSADTVTIRVLNVTAGAIDPASNDWRLIVFI